MRTLSKEIDVLNKIIVLVETLNEQETDRVVGFLRHYCDCKYDDDCFSEVEENV